MERFRLSDTHTRERLHYTHTFLTSLHQVFIQTVEMGINCSFKAILLQRHKKIVKFVTSFHEDASCGGNVGLLTGYSRIMRICATANILNELLFNPIPIHI